VRHPSDLIEAVRDSGVSVLTVVSNNIGVDGKGVGLLLENHQVAKVVASYVGENKLFALQYLDGEPEVEFNAQEAWRMCSTVSKGLSPRSTASEAATRALLPPGLRRT
jgi:acyl CoA:acetate/3-ketoacid CoA transferase alpha subunit